MHCAGLVMNDIIFLDILAHHGLYTKRYPREGILLFTSIVTSYLIPQTFFLLSRFLFLEQVRDLEIHKGLICTV